MHRGRTSHHASPTFTRTTHISITSPPPQILSNQQPRVLAVIAAWSRPGDVGNGALPRTRSNVVPSPFADVGGHPMVYHAWFAATKARCVARCVVATDEDDVQSAAVGFGAVVVRVDPYEEGMSARHAKRDKSTQKEYSAIGAAAFALRKAQALFLKSTDPEDRTEFDVVVVIDADELFVQAHHIEITADAVINRYVFPNHHIPPTDCPYGTDTFFFISQRRGRVDLDAGAKFRRTRFQSRLEASAVFHRRQWIRHESFFHAELREL